MTVSKTLGSGVALAGVVTSDEIEAKVHARGFPFYISHVSDPLPAAVGEAVIEVIESEGLRARALETGAYLRALIEDLQQRYEPVGDDRGVACCWAVKDRESRMPFHEFGARTTRRCMELGLSMNIRRRLERGSVWRIAPPLTASRDEIDRGVDIMDRALRETLDAMARPG